MNKKMLVAKLIELTKVNLQLAYEAAQNTYEIATNEENKAENKYDTKGLEASYLAGAQAERANDIKATLASYESINIKDYEGDNKIALTALIEISDGKKNKLVLLMPKGGGQIIEFEQKQIQVVTPESPLGKNLIGKELGDVIQISTGEKKINYEIISLV